MRRLAPLAAVVFLLLGTAGSADAAVVFNGSPGTGSPPPTLGPYVMQAFPSDSRPLNNDVSDIPTAPTGTLSFDEPVHHVQIGDGWGSWSNGYSGDVYYKPTGASNRLSVTMTLPAATGAFYVYAEPDAGPTHDVAATTDSGTSSGPVPVDSNSGARYFGFYATAGEAIRSVTVTVAAAGDDVAVGEMAIAKVPLPTVTQPSIGGATEVGKTLSAQAGATQLATSSYQWLRSTSTGYASIAGATGGTYKLTKADRGRRIELTQTARNAAGSSSATSSPTRPVGPPISKASAKKRQRVLRNGLLASVKSNLAGSVTASATVALPKGAAKVIRFKKVKRSLAAGKTRKLKLRLSRKGRVAVAGALAHRRALKAKLTLVVRDKSGGKASRKLAVKLVR